MNEKSQPRQSSFSDNPLLYPKIAIILKDRATVEHIAREFHIDIKAKRYDLGGKLVSQVETRGGYYVNPDERFYDYLRNKNTIEVGYSELIKSDHLSHTLDLKKSIIDFHLVNINFSFSYGGSFHDENGIHHDIRSYFENEGIIDRAVISFKTEIRYSKIDDKIYRKHTKEVLSIEYEEDKSNPKRIESFVQSFMPYLSFLSQSNVGFNHISQLKENSNNLINKYRVLTIKPRGHENHFDSDYVIDRSHHKRFMVV